PLTASSRSGPGSRSAASIPDASSACASTIAALGATRIGSSISLAKPRRSSTSCGPASPASRSASSRGPEQARAVTRGQTSSPASFLRRALATRRGAVSTPSDERERLALEPSQDPLPFFLGKIDMADVVVLPRLLADERPEIFRQLGHPLVRSQRRRK